MQCHLVMTLFFVACLTVLQSCLPQTEAASTERPYQFGFTIEKQQHRQEKKDERGIVMGEFGFITADGIYHVTVYATDEEGKFRILAMRSYPYEEHPKTIDMIVRPKAKAPTTPKAIAPPPPTTTTTTERAKPKPFEKHNFSVQGCSGCFIKNNAPTTTKATTPTQVPVDKKYEIRPLSKSLSPNGGTGNGKQIMAQILPQILQEMQKEVESRLEQKVKSSTPQANVIIQLHINVNELPKNTTKDKALIDNTQKTQTAAQTAAQNTKELTQKILELALSTQATTQSTLETTQNTEAIPNTLETQSNTMDTTQTIPNTLPLSTTTQTQLSESPTTPFVTISTDLNQLSSPAFLLTKESLPPPGNAINTNTGKTPKAGTPSQTGANAPSAGTPGGTNGFATPKKGLTPTGFPAGNAGVNRPNTNTGFGGSSGSSIGSGGQGARPSSNGLNGGNAGSGGFRGSSGSGGSATGGSSGAAGETGDLYRFKYLLDYNGHREQGARNGNKEGSFYAIGDDNVERTIEYIANEFGYQPRVRFRKLEAPVAAKENTLKDYEFVWFKEA